MSALPLSLVNRNELNIPIGRSKRQSSSSSTGGVFWKLQWNMGIKILLFNSDELLIFRNWVYISTYQIFYLLITAQVSEFILEKHGFTQYNVTVKRACADDIYSMPKVCLTCAWFCSHLHIFNLIVPLKIIILMTVLLSKTHIKHMRNQNYFLQFLIITCFLLFLKMFSSFLKLFLISS